MSKDKEAPAHGLIESAMGHVARGHEDPDKKSTDSPWRSNPGSDAALSHRLDQLKTALGSDTPAAPSLSALTNHREPGPPQTAQPKTLLLIRTGNDWRIAGEWQSTDLPRSATRK